MIDKIDSIFPHSKTSSLKLAVIEESQKHPCSKSTDLEKNIEDFPLGRFMRFLKHLKLKKLLNKITDPRDPKKTEHSIEVILMWVLSVFFFSM